MKVLLVVPPHPSPARGNRVTVERWRRGLEAVGVEVRVSVPEVLSTCIDADLIHAHHAAHCGPAARVHAARCGVPLVVSLGGTDLNGGPAGGPMPVALPVLTRARSVIAPSGIDLVRLRTYLSTSPRGFSVRRGVELRPVIPPKGTLGTALVLTVAGGIRPEKGQHRAVRWVAHLRDQGLDVVLRLVGPVVDPIYADRVRAESNRLEWVRWLGEVPPEQMAEVYAETDALLNVSRSEGASNALLEALAHGRPVVARNVSGNAHLLDGAPETVALCAADGDLDRVGVWLAALGSESSADRADRTERAHRWVLTNHHVDDEIRELRAAYHYALQAPAEQNQPVGSVQPGRTSRGFRGGRAEADHRDVLLHQRRGENHGG